MNSNKDNLNIDEDEKNDRTMNNLKTENIEDNYNNENKENEELCNNFVESLFQNYEEKSKEENEILEKNKELTNNDKEIPIDFNNSNKNNPIKENTETENNTFIMLNEIIRQNNENNNNNNDNVNNDFMNTEIKNPIEETLNKNKIFNPKINYNEGTKKSIYNSIDEKIIEFEENEKLDNLKKIEDEKNIHKKNVSPPKLKISISNIQKKYIVKNNDFEKEKEEIINDIKIKRTNSTPIVDVNILNKNNTISVNNEEKTFQDNERSISINYSSKKIKENNENNDLNKLNEEKKNETILNDNSNEFISLEIDENNNKETLKESNYYNIENENNDPINSTNKITPTYNNNQLNNEEEDNSNKEEKKIEENNTSNLEEKEFSSNKENSNINLTNNSNKISNKSLDKTPNENLDINSNENLKEKDLKNNNQIYLEEDEEEDEKSNSYLENNEKKKEKTIMSEYQLSNYREHTGDIIKIQKNWKTHFDVKKFLLLKEKVFYIQRAFRNHLIIKYTLPQNFYYNDKFLKIQSEIFEENYKKNLSVLFPALFLDKTNVNTFASDMLLLSNNPIHNPYEQGKIYLFAKILDFDMMIDTDEIYDNLWSSNFNSIYTKCLKVNDPIQLINLGSQHTLCISQKGKIYSFGWNNYGQCGVPINSTIIHKNEIENNLLLTVNKYNELKLKVLNKVDGIKIPEIEQIILSKGVTCGEDHSLILDQNGNVWSFGLNLNGQLGLGHNNIVEKPCLISKLKNNKIVNVKSSGYINFAISDKGNIYMWPWQDKKNNNNIIYSPCRFSLKNYNEKVINISCGSNFCIILNNNGQIYSMGKSNKYGELGLGDCNPRYHPSLITYFLNNNERINQISCGYKHTLVKTTTGKVYSWGYGGKGQLGRNSYNNCSTPGLIKFENAFTKIYQISAGFRSSFFLCENRKIYACGCNGTLSMEKVPILFDIISKIPEMSIESNYSVVRIMNSWCKSFSIFYATIADSSIVKINPVKLNSILNNLASKWISESIEPPYIESIASFFPISVMRKKKNN